MRPNVLSPLSIASMLALAGTGLAQQPAPAPAPAPGPPADYGAPITNEQAKAVAGAAFAEAKKNNWRMAIAILGPAGGLVSFERMDGTQLASAQTSQGQARTAGPFPPPRQAVPRPHAPRHTPLTPLPQPPRAP